MIRIPALSLLSYMNSKPSTFRFGTSDGGKNTSLWGFMQIIYNNLCKFLLQMYVSMVTINYSTTWVF